MISKVYKVFTALIVFTLMLPFNAQAFNPDVAFGFDYESSYPFSISTSSKDTDLRPFRVKQELSLRVKGNDRFYEATYGKMAHHLTYFNENGKITYKAKTATRGRSLYTFSTPSLLSSGQFHYSLNGNMYGKQIETIDRATVSSFKPHSSVKGPNQVWKFQDELFVDHRDHGLLIQYADAKGRTIEQNIFHVLPVKNYQNRGFYPLTQKPKNAVSVKVWTYKGKYRSLKPQYISLLDHYDQFKLKPEITIDNKAEWSHQLVGNIHWFSTEIDRQKEFIQYELYFGKAAAIDRGAPYLVHTKYLGGTKTRKDDRYQFDLKKLQYIDSPYDSVYLVAKTTKGKVLVSELHDNDMRNKFDHEIISRPLVSVDFDRSTYSPFPSIDTQTVTVRTYPKDANVSVWAEYADAELIKSINGFHTFRFLKPLKPSEEYMIHVAKDGYASYRDDGMASTDTAPLRQPAPTVAKFTKTSISGTAKPGTVLYVVNSKNQGVHFETVPDNGRFNFRFNKSLTAGAYTISSYSHGTSTTASIKRTIK